MFILNLQRIEAQVIQQVYKIYNKSNKTSYKEYIVKFRIVTYLQTGLPFSTTQTVSSVQGLSAV